jgi:ribosomal protein L7Ae-like RNA K-turn-binding protein
MSGYAALHKALAQRQVVYMVLATDIAAARADSYRAWCERLAIPYKVYGSKQELGRLLDRPSRSAIGFTEPCFAARWHTLMAAAEHWHASHGASEGRTAFSYTAL